MAIEVDEWSSKEVGPDLSLHRMVAVMVLVRNENRDARYVFAFSRSDNEFIQPDVRDDCALKGGGSTCERQLVGEPGRLQWAQSVGELLRVGIAERRIVGWKTGCNQREKQRGAI
jgi:hypothetical protein